MCSDEAMKSPGFLLLMAPEVWKARGLIVSAHFIENIISLRWEISWRWDVEVKACVCVCSLCGWVSKHLHLWGEENCVQVSICEFLCVCMLAHKYVCICVCVCVCVSKDRWVMAPVQRAGPCVTCSSDCRPDYLPYASWRVEGRTKWEQYANVKAAFL